MVGNVSLSQFITRWNVDRRLRLLWVILDHFASISLSFDGSVAHPIPTVTRLRRSEQVAAPHPSAAPHPWPPLTLTLSPCKGRALGEGTRTMATGCT